MSSKSRTDAAAGEYSFPPHFVLGAATSAYQIEGCTEEALYGRGASIWDEYFSKHCELENGCTAAGHYSRMPEDVALMKELGLQSYRFSISWPRVLPAGRGRLNPKGLDFYDRLVDELLAASIVPNLTLYHWDLPQALEEIGGWCARDTALYFADYAAAVACRLGDRVPLWATLNEPEVIVAGYIGAGFAPGRNDPALRMRVAHNLLLAHGSALQALRPLLPERQLGIVLNLVPIDPITESARDAAARRWMREYAFYLEALTKAAYPELVIEEAERSGVEIRPGDMAIIAQKLDFLGVNWYLRLVVDEQGRLVELPDVPRTLMGWEVRPEALTRTLTSIWADYRLPPIYITENGAALEDLRAGGEIKDPGRQAYIAEHLHAIEQAIQAGVDVRGYYVWSLLDNLEWSLGYSKTFGLVHVDRETLERTPKQSARWYQSLIARHAACAAPRSLT